MKEELSVLKEKIEEIKAFGDVPAYSVEIGYKYIYVCRNNGQFHKGDAPSGSEGWATFIGKFTAEEIKKEFGLYGL